MLHCTPAAAAALQEVRERNAIPREFGVRLSPTQAPDGDVGLGIAFTAEPAAGDEVTEQHGTTLIVAPEISEQMAGLMLDVVPDPTLDGDRPPQLMLRPSDQT